MGIGAAILGAGVVAGGSSIIGSSAAAGAQESAANTAANTQLNIYGQNKAMLQPWNDAGFGAYGTLNQLLGVGGSGDSTQMQKTLEGLPGYQFTLNQGLKSVQNSAAARGLGTSGAALKGAAAYGTGLANSTYGTYVNQLQNSSNTGLSAGAALAGVGTTTGQGVANSQIAGGNAAAAGYNGAAAGVGNAASALPLYALLNQQSNGGQISGPFNSSDLAFVP